jgi:hypothetical protein
MNVEGALSRLGGNTLEPCNAGFIGMEWVIEDFSIGEFQQSWWM